MTGSDRLDEQFLRQAYELLVRPRLIEEKMLVLLRQGRLGKWFSGIGQEAISVGATLAMKPDEYLLPVHRNLGVFTTRQVPLRKLMNQFLGHVNGFTKGRDRSFHFGSKEHHLVGMISHLGAQLPVACGIALAEKLAGSGKAVLAFTGEGATSQGDFHESLNLASVWGLPVIFLIENNGYALSTPTSEQYRSESLAARAAAYGINGIQIDGNDLVLVWETIRNAREHCLSRQQPYLVECMTFRMRGHEEASGTAYVPTSQLEEWSRKDPIHRYEHFLMENGRLTADAIGEIKNTIREEIDRDIREALNDPSEIPVSEARELEDMYASTPQATPGPEAPREEVPGETRFIDAVSEAMRQAMHRHPRLVLMGQDIAEYGGVFKATAGLLEEFGKDRVRNTPLCESAIIGAAFGLSIAGYHSIVEMQFADFISTGFNQVVNNLAKSHYRWGQSANVVIRMPTGAGTAAGPFHSQSTEAWFTKTPGLKVVYPAFPFDAKGLLLAAVEDPNPVLFFEHKFLYRTLSEAVPSAGYALPIGKARLIRSGNQVSVITYGLGVHWTLEILDRHPEIDADLVDLRSLAPWDRDAVAASVRKTGKVLIVHEDTLTGGFGGEIAAWLAEHCFQFLDAPIRRCASLDTAVPMNAQLESNFLANARLSQCLLELIAY